MSERERGGRERGREREGGTVGGTEGGADGEREREREGTLIDTYMSGVSSPLTLLSVLCLYC